MLLASDLYAISQSSKCEGNDECHYCSAPCKKHLPHMEPVPLPGNKRPYVAKRPGNGYICMGCWLWRRQSLTIEWMDGKLKNGAIQMGGFRDRQTPSNHSWYITDERAWSVMPHPHHLTSQPTNEALYSLLLKPKIRFCLALLEGGSKNHLQLMIANEIAKIEADTPITYTVNGIPYHYTVYELEEALKYRETEGKEPGVAMLLHLLGPSNLFPPKVEEKKMGRPPALEDGRVTKKTVSASGQKV